MNTKTWRDHCRPIIAKVIAENSGDEAALKKALYDAYPYGQRAYHPYKVWLSEIRFQLGKQSRLGPKKKYIAPQEERLF